MTAINLNIIILMFNNDRDQWRVFYFTDWCQFFQTDQIFESGSNLADWFQFLRIVSISQNGFNFSRWLHFLKIVLISQDGWNISKLFQFLKIVRIYQDGCNFSSWLEYLATRASRSETPTVAGPPHSQSGGEVRMWLQEKYSESRYEFVTNK